MTTAEIISLLKRTHRDAISNADWCVVSDAYVPQLLTDFEKAIEALKSISGARPYVPNDERTYEGLEGNAGDVFSHGWDCGNSVQGDAARSVLKDLGYGEKE